MNRSIEKSWRDLPGFQRLKTRSASRAHALETQNDAGATVRSSQPGQAAEVGEFQSEILQEDDIGWQRPLPGSSSENSNAATRIRAGNKGHFLAATRFQLAGKHSAAEIAAPPATFVLLFVDISL
jgi:hypothetical protein